MTTNPITPPARTGRVLPPALIVAGLLLVGGNLRAGITTVGPVLTNLQQDLGITSSTASILVSLPLLAFAIVSPFAPRLARRIGLERALGAGLIVLAVGLVLRSVVGDVWLWVGTGLLGIAIAVLNVVLPALVKRDFPTKIGQITGAYSAVQSIFAATAAGIAVPLAGATDLGWRFPLAIWAGLALIALGVLSPQLRRRTVVPERQDDVRLDTDSVSTRGWVSPWKSALGWQVTAFMGLQSVGFYIFITWLPAIEAKAGISEAAAGGHQFLLNGFGIVGSLLCSAFIARFRDQRLLAMTAPLLFVIAALGILFLPSAAAIWDSIAGIAGGASIVLSLSFFGLRTDHHTQAATLSGMAQSIGYLLAAAGPIAVGALHDVTGSWTPALVVVIVLEAILIVFGYLAGRNRTIG